MNNIKPSQLLTGDLLFYNNDSFVAKAIRKFDDCEYNHVAICDGCGQVVEAIGRGVVMRSVQSSCSSAVYVDVFRNAKIENLPIKPLLSSMEDYASKGDEYAYGQIFLLAMITQMRKNDSILLNIFHELAEEMEIDLAETGKKKLICSELGYRCFVDSGISYVPEIRGSSEIVDPDFVTPGDMRRSGDINKIGRLVLS